MTRVKLPQIGFAFISLAGGLGKLNADADAMGNIFH